MNRDQRSIHDALTRDQDALRSDMEAIGRDFRKALDEATARELAAINAHHDRLTREVCADDCTVTVKVEQDEPAESSPPPAPIAIAIKEARRQLAAIVEACAEGHLWGDGRNRSWGEKVTAYDCQRPGCTWSKTEPGWLPFEPKQHVVPFAPTLRDCTGPGCEHCADEAFGEQLRRSLADIGAVEFIGEALSGPAPSDTVITAKKIGYTWAVDATPEQVQAALDARNGES